jgi:predicted ATPase
LDEIILHADGVPLFVEELTKTVMEGVLLRAEGDRYVLDGPLTPLAVPTTLQAALMARLDRVPAVKEVAQIGAVLGREFSYELIQAVAPLSAAALDNALDRLVASGLVFSRGAPPQTSYIFKHALVQDAAYETMLKAWRQHLHARIADVLERSRPEMVARQPEHLAHHWAKAGASAKAAELWTAAAERAQTRGANREASEFYERALAALHGLEETPEVLTRLVDLRRALFTTHYLAGELRRLRADLEEAERLATRLNDTNQLSRILGSMTYFLGSTGEVTAAISAGERAVAIARRTGDLESQTNSGLMLARALCAKGRYRDAIGQIHPVIAILGEDVQRGQFRIGMNLTIATRVWLTICCAELGDFAESAASSAVALQMLAEVEGENENLIWWRIGAGRLAVLQDDFAKAVGTCHRTLLWRVRHLFLTDRLVTGSGPCPLR